MKFLETITALGNDVLVAVDRIKYIYCTYGNNGWEIHIKGDDDQSEWVEHFEKNDEKFNFRYKMIKDLLGVVSDEKYMKKMSKNKTY